MISHTHSLQSKSMLYGMKRDGICLLRSLFDGRRMSNGRREEFHLEDHKRDGAKERDFSGICATLFIVWRQSITFVVGA